MNDHLGLQRTLAVVLGGSLMCAAGAGLAFDIDNMMSPSQGMGGNSWVGPGYGYGGPGAYARPYGPAGLAPYGSDPYGTIPYGSGPGRFPAGYAPPASQVREPVEHASTPLQDQALHISDLERRMGELEEAHSRRQNTQLPPLWSFDSAYGPRAP